MNELYEQIGRSYLLTRKQDPRIAAAIMEALGEAGSVLNVGAGAGAYEPSDRVVLAVEPSEAMIAQRPRGAAPVLRARAERIPLPSRSFDAVLAVNTVHHWTDLSAGLREIRRIARRRIVIFLRDSRQGMPFWLTEDYLRSLDPSGRHARIVPTIMNELPGSESLPVQLPRDCSDGLFTAYWGRPEMYLDPLVRRNSSNFVLAREDELAAGLLSLRADLESGEWDRKYGYLRSLSEIDIGHRILISELRG